MSEKETRSLNESTEKTASKNPKKRGKTKTKKAAFKHLSFNDRLKIEAWLKVKTPIAKIAEMLGKTPATIYREIKKGTYSRLNGDDYIYYEAYSPDIADMKYRENLKAKGGSLKIGSDMEYAEYIEHKIIDEKYSPKAVLGEIKRKNLKFNTTISYTTLYRYIDEGIFLHLTNNDLPVKKNKNKNDYKKVKRVQSRPSKGDSIEIRPKEIGERTAFGHWEMDCVIGAKTKSKVLLVLTERLTRREIVRLMPSKEEIAALEEWMNEYPREIFQYETAASRFEKEMTKLTG